MTTLAGNYPLGEYEGGHDDGVGTSASFSYPYGMSIDAAWTRALVVRGHGGTNNIKLAPHHLHPAP